MGTKPSKKRSQSGQPDFDVSLVIPCYNEVFRLDNLFGAVNQFVNEWKGRVEVVIVDDGSTDGTSEAISERPDFRGLNQHGKVILVELATNQGKGGALREGVAKATSQYILTLDADMSAKPIELLRWWESSKKHFDGETILIGSREHNGSRIEASRGRRIVGNIFNIIVTFFTALKVRDSQCGFKLYPAKIAKALFSSLKVTGWAHDVELLFRAHLLGIRIKEMPLEWKEEPGSKVKVMRDSFRMLAQVFRIGAMLRWRYFVTDPIRQTFGKGRGQLVPGGDRRPIFRFLFALSIAVLFVGMPILSRDYGITGDERIQFYYGEHLRNYFSTLGSDTVAQDCCPEADEAYRNLHYYGGLFDLISSVIHHGIGGDDPFRTRHATNAVFGFIAILFTGLLAKRFGGYQAAFLAVVILTLTSRFFGHSMNNPKDIPFAAAYIFTLYYLIKVVPQLPKPALYNMVMLAVGIALSINIRIGGLLLIAYFGLFTLWEAFGNPRLRKSFSNNIGTYLKIGIPLVVLGYFGGLVFWPYAHLDPIGNPFEALGKMSQFETSIRLLFEGEYIMSSEVPWYYIPKYIGITAPLILLIGLLLTPVAFWALTPPKRRYLMIWFSATFPVVYAIYNGSPLYDGMRHFLFVLPPLAVLASIHWNSLFELARKKVIRYGAILAFITLALIPLRWMVMNHPNQVVYFNEAFGGVDEAVGVYETDYWYNSIRPAITKLIKKDALRTQRDTIVVLSNASFQVRNYFEKAGIPVEVNYAKFGGEHEWPGYDKNRRRVNKRFEPWDYAVFVSRYADKDEIQNYWPPVGTYLSERADAAALTVILKHINDGDVRGFTALQSGNWREAIGAFKEHLTAKPNSSIVWYYLGISYLNIGSVEEAIGALQKSLELRPEAVDLRIYSYITNAYIESGKPQEAIQFAEGYIRKYESKFTQLSANLQRKDRVSQDAFNEYLRTIQTLKELSQALAGAYSTIGDAARAQEYARATSQYQNMLQQYQQ